ncbi:YciI family protein [Chromobacterium sp. IIBBL 290-4]|uniref:YciI family protein n=1 Tax=Chromobacterium sp. IIBBL 290-4 TaxID=2953890 RepID=UPI0020B65CB2|nr:YciI family protein [Chromobacterium sp. IIBBL 290-4]UTH75380.1 YciI family protein [Chromobacterium sp. IIBBL 290-4]
MFVVSLTYIAPLSDVDALLAAHVEWLKQAYADGLFVASGRKVPRDGGVILARGERAALEARLAQDPFAKGGVARYDIIEFVPSMAAPGLEGLKEA